MEKGRLMSFEKDRLAVFFPALILYILHILYAAFCCGRQIFLSVLLYSGISVAIIFIGLFVVKSAEVSKRAYYLTVIISSLFITQQIRSEVFVLMVFMGVIYQMSLFMDTRVISEAFFFSQASMLVYLIFFFDRAGAGFSLSYLIIEEGVYIAFYILLVGSTKRSSEYVFSYEIKALQAEEANMSKNIFLANMSHEIRTPLNAIKGMSDLMSERELSPIEREYMRNIQRSSDELLAIVNNLLDFANIESGKMEFLRNSYDMGSMIHDLCTEVNRKIENKPISFILDIDPYFPHFLKGDQGRVRQMLENVLDNAVKFTVSGSVYMGVRCEPKNGSGHIYIDVTDTGVGIKDSDLRKIFDAFSQADMHHHRRAEGTGLGLSIVKRLVKSMDGDIHIVSRENEGTTVKLDFYQEIESDEPFVTLGENAETRVFLYEPNRTYADNLVKTLETLGAAPVKLQSLDYVREDLSQADGGIVLFDDLRGGEFFEQIKDEFKKLTFISMFSACTRVGRDDVPGIIYAERPITILSLASFLNHRFEKVSYEASDNEYEEFSAPDARVLVVDDNETNIRVAEGFLLKYDVQITSVFSGYDCIKELGRSSFDIVFMDHMMPNLDGAQTTSIIRKGEAGTGRHQIIVALTANAVDGAEQMLLDCGMDAFMSKPIDSLRLNYIMRKYIPDELKQKKLPGSEAQDDTGTLMSTDNIDTDLGIKTTGGDRSNYLSILKTAYNEGRRQIGDIRNQLEAGDIKGYIINVHSVKSTMKGIGALELSELAKSHEFAGKDGNIEFIKNDIDNLLEKFSAVLTEMKAILDDAEGEKKDEGPGEQKEYVPAEQLSPLLEEAAKALDAFDSERAEEILKEAAAHRSDIEDEIADVRSLVDVFEYEEAIKKLMELLQVAQA